MDEILHVIMVLSNPVNFKRRVVLAKEFIERMENTKNVLLYCVELAYGDQLFSVTSPDNPRHLQLRCETPLWHKENMINLGVKRLLPESWKAMAWIDADLEFTNPNWVSDALLLFNQGKDIIQLFDVVTNISLERKRIYALRVAYVTGYAWACTRSCYERMGGLYEYNIIGGGDTILYKSINNKIDSVFVPNMTVEYINSIKEYSERCKDLQYGNISGQILHHFHGSYENRQYGTRKEILYSFFYKPSFVEYNSDGVLVPSVLCPQELLSKIRVYFLERNDDEGYA